MSYLCQYCDKPFTINRNRKRHEKHYCWKHKLKVSKPKDDLQQALEKIQKALQEVLMDLSEPRPDVTSTSCCEQRI